MPKTSAGLLMYRITPSGPEFLLAHPGGPMWRNHDAGFWSIPKGELHVDEDPLEAAKREFTEETGVQPEGPLIPLPTITQKSGKRVMAWAFRGDCDTNRIQSNTCAVEWPPHSGKLIQVPEIDRAEFFDYTTACVKINPAQITFLDAVRALIQT